MGSRVDNSCPMPPSYDPSVFENQPADTTAVGPSCPVSESESGARSAAKGEPNAPKSTATPSLPPHPATDPLVRSALGPMLDIKDPKALASARERLERESEPADVQAVREILGDEAAGVYKAMKRDLSEPHHALQATGKIPHTKFPFSEVEIRENRIMSRSERYDTMWVPTFDMGRKPRK